MAMISTIKEIANVFKGEGYKVTFKNNNIIYFDMNKMSIEMRLVDDLINTKMLHIYMKSTDISANDMKVATTLMFGTNKECEVEDIKKLLGDTFFTFFKGDAK